jgi:hypothetical protein
MYSLIARVRNTVSKNKARSVLTALAVLFCAVWISQTWTQSSYGHVLRAFQARDDGVVVGTPRGIISDEWGMVTPWTQATVNNGLQRYNRTSFYGEDLRIGISLPLKDWGLAFKPDKWLYPLVNAAYAFSFQSLFFLCAFVAGYALLFRRLGAQTAESAFLSVTLLCTAFVQIWWGILGPTVAMFPWVLLALDVRTPALRFAAIVWTSAAWMLVFFYPGMFVPLAIAAAAIVLTVHLRGDRPLALLVPALGVACAIAIVVFYLRDYLIATWNTAFPGHRRMNGGGVPAEMFADMLWPGSHLLNFESTTKLNVAEASVVGTIYLLLTLVFLDYRRAFATAMDAPTRRLVIAMLIALAILTAWEVLPIPAQWAGWTLLPWVLPRRAVFASGLLVLILAVVVSHAYGLVFSRRRYVALCAAVVFGWGITKANAAAPWMWRVWPDLLVIPIAAVTLIRHPWIEQRRHVVLAACSALFAVLAFGWFNPIQRAWPIFNREPTPLTRDLDRRQDSAPGHVLVSDQFGATLNGWGYRSVAHALFVPPMARWREIFPDLEPDKLDFIFNRYAHITPIDELEPRLITNTMVGVPRRHFLDAAQAQPEDVRGIVRAERLTAAVSSIARNGHVDTRREDGNRVVLSGWAPWKGLTANQVLTVLSDVDAQIVRFSRARRPDVVAVHHDPELEYSGFTVEVELASTAGDPKPRVCLVAQQDASAPRTMIEEPGSRCPK